MTAPRAALAAASTSGPPVDQGSDDPHAHDVGRGAEGDFCADAAVLGGTAQGTGEGEVGPPN